jgi:hypothetical protein
MIPSSLRALRRQYFSVRAQRVIRRHRPTRRPLIPYSTVRLDEPFNVLVVGRSEFFTPYRDALVASLQGAGAEAHAAADLDAIDDPGSVHAIIVIGPHEHVMRRHRHRLSRSVLSAIQTEQLPTQRQGGYSMSSRRLADVLVWSTHYDLLFEWSRDAAPLLHGLGLNVVHLPHGHLRPDGANATVPVAETHDVIFLGGLGGPQKRRRRLINALSGRFSIHPATGRKIWGAAKAQALRESRLVLNLHSEQSQAFASPRFFETLSLGRPLVSEGVADPWPFVPGVDYFSCALPGLETTIEQALGDDALRLRVAASGFARSLEHPLDGVARRMLTELLALHRAIAS